MRFRQALKSRKSSGRAWAAAFVVFALWAAPTCAQIRDELAMVVRSQQSGKAPAKSPGASGGHWGHGSELRPLTLGMLRLYKDLISSQDGQTCNFTVSCSRFAEIAIRRYGLVHALAMASDRIQRCNSISRAAYPADPRTGLAVDWPIERYYLTRTGRQK